MEIGKLSSATALMMTFALGCGGPDAVPSDLPTCTVSTMRLEGTVDGVVIGFDQPAGGGGFDQDDRGGTFITPQGRSSSHRDQSAIDVVLDWTGRLDDGESRAANGTTVLPAGTPAGLAGAYLCAGSGSEIAMVPEGMRFRLASLRKGARCDQPVTGELRGCWSPR